MVQKEFTYKGKSLDELKKMSLAEFSMISKADARRKIRRLTDADKKLIAKVEKSQKPVKTHNRDMVIVPVFIGKTIMIHDGKSYQPLLVMPEMIGHWFGEYAMTRRKVQHNAPGIGATRSSASMSVK
jgi:small subunit ribosomal protein S19